MAATAFHFRGMAVDIGNSAVHAGRFGGSMDVVGQPEAVSVIPRSSTDLSPLAKLAEGATDSGGQPSRWYLASVNDARLRDVQAWLTEHLPQDHQRVLAAVDLPIAVAVDHPERVGIDRLLAVVTAEKLSAKNTPVIVVDAGTAITVDVLDGGAFQGGAILPGMRMTAAALDRYTEKLPLIELDAVDRPEVIGNNTVAALKSGVFWGAVGAVRELVDRIARQCSQPPQIYITGGDGHRLAPHLSGAQFVSHLVLSGIAIAAAHVESNRR